MWAGYSHPALLLSFVMKDRQEKASQLDGFFFTLELCFAPIPILSPKSEIVIHLTADMDVCEQLRPAYVHDIKKYF